MTKGQSYRPAMILAALAAFCTNSASALPIREFRKYSKEHQSVYISGAISMTVYSLAANGEPVRARCFQDWYFGQTGVETPGPRAVALELGVAERKDPAKFHVEGIILGLADKVCGDAARTK